MSPQEPAMSSMITRELLAVVMAILFLFFLLLLLFYVHARRYRASHHAVLSSRIQFLMAVGPGTAPWQGLDPAVIRALPVTLFRSEDFKQGLECPVCLCELSEGEEARFLPKCSHGFHLQCIDMWLHSHSTCPLCRIPVCPEPMQSAPSTESAGIPPVGEVSGDGHPTQPQNFTANVLFRRSQNQDCGGGPAASTHQESSSSAGSSTRTSERMLVIDIPSRAVDGFQSPSSPLPLSKLPAEDIRSPMSVRLRSLRGLLSRRSRGFGSFCSPIEGDIEQGLVGVGGAVEGGLQVPKTPVNA